MRFTINAIRRTTDMICRDLPDAVRRAGIDALLVDQTEPAGGSVAMYTTPMPITSMAEDE